MVLSFRAPSAAAPVPASAREKVLQMNFPGAILICAAVASFTLALRWAGVSKAWSNSEVVGLLVATALFLTAFVADQWFEKERALIIPSFLHNRVLIVGAVFEFL